jgi:hypothetical protein
MLHCMFESVCCWFAGSVYSRSGIAEWGGPINGLPASEGVVICALADGKPYSCVLVDEDGYSYVARFNTRVGYNNVRLTINMFRPEVYPDMAEKPPPLRPEKVTLLKFRCAVLCLCLLAGEPSRVSVCVQGSVCTSMHTVLVAAGRKFLLRGVRFHSHVALLSTHACACGPCMERRTDCDAMLFVESLYC